MADFRVTKERLCRGCRRSTGQTSMSVLRAGGWRIYDGPSLTGKELHITVCPWCAGTTDKPMPGWRVGCNTCDWEYDPDEECDEPITSEKDADQIARDHECEKWTWTKPPPMPPQPRHGSDADGEPVVSEHSACRDTVHGGSA